jgi:uncharacterized NAD(P)/FAD-binding protein YdhS
VKTVIVVGGGVAGSEAGTFLGYHAKIPLKIVEIEAEPSRKFGGWAFQSFPSTETTNLAMRKMYLGSDPEEIHRWAGSPEARQEWPAAFREQMLDSDQPFPRALMKQYVLWRRGNVHNDLVSFSNVTGEAMKVRLLPGQRVAVELDNGKIVHGDRLIMASGSISVKVPNYLKHLADHKKVIIDPLVREGHERRAKIPPDAKVLILGTGLTGEEQVSVLLNYGHTNLTLLSRGGQRHFSYPRKQTNQHLVLETPPDFLHAETAEDFNHRLTVFFEGYLEAGHSPEDIYAAIRPHWNQMRADVGGCYKAAGRLFEFRRTLATHSIGTSWEVTDKTRKAENDGHLTLARGYVSKVEDSNGAFVVSFSETLDASDMHSGVFDYIINAVGRNIIRHPIWDRLLEDGLGKKHAGIGVRITEEGQLLNNASEPSSHIWIVGMARAGDHALRHGFLGNTAFNVPQVRSHVYRTVSSMLDELTVEDTLLKPSTCPGGDGSTGCSY